MNDGRRDHAVVIGAGMAGLLAAHVLAEHFAQVTVLDRDAAAADASGPRRGVPQGRHAHALLARGLGALEELFPGLCAELVAGGAPEGDMLRDYRLEFGGHRLRKAPSGLRAISMSRPHLESRVRRRVLAAAAVRMRAGCDAAGLTTDGRGDVNGVRVVDHLPGSSVEELDADLVVDAAGRGSRLPAWLADIGTRPPSRERIGLGLGYVSCRFRLAPDALDGDLGVIRAPTPDLPRAAAFARIETGEWLLTVAGMGADHPPLDRDGLLRFTASLPCPDLADALRTATPTTDAVPFRFTAAVRRRYDRLRELPAGLVALGDGVCSLDPLYGQGITVAALQAMRLRDDLRHGRATQRMQSHAVAATRTAWGLAMAADLTLPGVAGHPGLGQRMTARYVERVQAAGGRDARAAVGFLRVTGLVDPPASLFRRRILCRALGVRRDRSVHRRTRLSATALRLLAAALVVPLGSVLGAALALVAALRRRGRRDEDGMPRARDRAAAQRPAASRWR